MRDDVESGRVEPLCEGIVHEEGRHAQNPWIVQVFQTVALERAEVVGVAPLDTKVLENGPVPIPAFRPELALEMSLEVGLDVIVVDQRVVDVQKKHGVGKGSHARHRFAAARAPGGRGTIFTGVMAE